MTRVAYLDCFSGISGDMLLGALIDAGAGERALRDELAKLDIGGWSLRAERVTRAGIAATLARVELAERAQPHRRLPDVLRIIEASSLGEVARAQSAAVFHALANAEARVHGIAPEEVAFHEVGALDAIVDVVGAIAGLGLLGVGRVYCSALPAGGGAARSEHGALPVPAPATLELIAAAGAPLAPPGREPAMELVTPTGAAIATTLATFERPAMTVRAVGHGAGGRDPDGWPNILRLWVGEAERGAARPAMTLVETNIDDMNPEILAYVVDRLLAAGAVDAWLQPIQMKKSRAGVLLSALCAPEREDEIAGLILRETSTLGVRVREVRRHEAQRESLEFESSIGPAAVKVKRLPGEPPRVAPEYEACRRLAESTGRPLIEVYSIVEREALARL